MADAYPWQQALWQQLAGRAQHAHAYLLHGPQGIGKRALADAKLPASASLYALRHSHISRAIEEDVPLFIIARNVGTSERMIRVHYAHLLAKKERAMLERAAKAIRLRVIDGGAPAKASAA